ncbi:protocadherin-like protein isoform X1 [Nematostella vectensis]|nr:protocadherin-like protein isoform X1 [Nematostella vectensis]XP_048576732.1 protocadherin-like protein isoform X1 [Nematostella vectensis]XP_048576733.1 protocadherin-like protein isoform X1 [Nematostella vectensis]
MGLDGSASLGFLVLFTLLSSLTITGHAQTIESASVPENEPEGFRVFSFPSPPSNEIYSFFRALDTASQSALRLFDISEDGVVVTKNPLVYTDGEENLYVLTVLRRQRGMTEGGIAWTLRITVTDTNNFQPTFGADLYLGYIAEEAAQGTTVGGLEKCHAEDKDRSGIDRYEIVSGNERGYFVAETKTVGAQKFLVLKATNTRIVRDPARPSITLTVRANDGGGLHGTTRIQIDIQDTNNNPPVFEKSEYTVTVGEDTPVMTSILRVRARDADIGRNGGIYYYLRNTQDFTIDAITGVIRPIRMLDFQSGQQRTLEVTARDRGSSPKAANVNVQVTIRSDISGYPPVVVPSSSSDRNRPPVFPEGSSFTLSIREDFPVNGAIQVVKANDPDAGSTNGQLRYSLSGNNNFAIDSTSGVVTLQTQLEYKGNPAQDVIDLVVTATDRNGQSGALSASVNLKIEVLDVDDNNNAPVFNPQQLELTVSEDSAVGRTIRRVSATDSDDGSDGQVVYSIIQGSGLGVFQVQATTGDLIVAAPLDREKMSFYDLVIKAEDKATFPKSSNLYVMVKIQDVDDHFPQFTQPMYYAKAPEKSPENTFVTVVKVVDHDLGESVSYSITGASSFKIVPTSGLILTTGPIDLTTEPSTYELVVTATSTNYGTTKRATGQVNVEITSKTESPPVFKNTPYAVSVPENQGSIANLVCVAAIDTKGQPVIYSIESRGEPFGIDSKSGRFSSLQSFDYETADKYRIQISAQSGTAPNIMTSSSDVAITIKDEKDPPQFSQSEYKVSVPEDASVRSTLSRGIRFVDEDTLSTQLECSMEEMTSRIPLDYLSVVQDGGECKFVIEKTLDTFVASKFTFDMKVTDKNFPGMFATTKVEVTVTDTNTYTPVFSRTSFWASKPDTLPTDTSVMQLSIIDKDMGSLGEVTYQLIDPTVSAGETSGYDRFRVDDSGMIESTNILTANTLYKLQAKAKDGGSPALEATVDVFISVYPSSDTPVRFSQNPYSASIAENSPLNTEVFRATATKSGSSSGIAYSLVGGQIENGNTMFSIDSSGRVLLLRQLDRERTKSYKLYVRGTYTGGSLTLATDVECLVTVTDVNDNTPLFTFDRVNKQFVVDNYAPANTIIATLRAVDSDEGANAQVTMSIQGTVPSNAPFTIDTPSNVLKTTTKLSTVIDYQITVRATDKGSPPQYSETTVIVKVLNIQTPPVFGQAKYTVDVQENTKVGQQVISVKATYGDSNALLQYSFVSGNLGDAFCIDSSGQITVAQPLDREVLPSYTLRVRVALGNNEDFTEVVVSLTDINDDSPTFTKSVYEFFANEDISSGTSIGKVAATDRDSGSHGQISYRFLYASDIQSMDKFDLDQTTGIISLASGKSLDYEDISMHVLFVRAEDNGANKLSAIAEVRIYLRDINDNDPKFSAASYHAKLSLDAPVLEHVVQVTATDLDTANNGRIRYSIVAGNQEGAFQVLTDNGLIRVAKSLTTVAASSFLLTLEAADSGDPERKGSVNVQVNVFLPDGPPKFVLDPVIVNATEGIAANQRVAVAKAATSEALKYEILSGNTNDMFAINPSSGVILTTRELDYEEATGYIMNIIARDTRDRSASVQVIINVVNINDNEPMFPGETNGQIDRKVAGPFAPGVIATRLTAVDKDIGDRVYYKISIEAENYFTIDERGQLICKNDLKGIASPFRFTIEARDGGLPQKVHTANVLLVFVNYRPKQQPVRVIVPETTRAGTVITRVPRYFPTGEFSIVYPEKTNFTIDNDGNVTLNRPLDYEEIAFTLITVREKQASGPLENYIDVEITVLDENDNAPFFTMISTLGRVNSNSRAGATAFQLQARDLDSGSNGLIGFQLENIPTLFMINPLTRQIEVGQPRLQTSRYGLDIIPFDYGKPSVNGTKATVDIETVQSPPVFNESSYTFTVSERAPTMTKIGDVTAVSVSGARLSYTIIEGNTGDKFLAKDNGDIVLNSLLDFERDQSVFNLKVEAKEQIPKGLSSEVDVTITVINANDFHPYFDDPVYRLKVPESRGVGDVIMTVTARDCDCPSDCTCPVGQLKYSVEAGTSFDIDQTGAIVVARTLDYETSKVQVLKVMASDQGEKVFTAVTFVVVTLEDTNDNAPVFKRNDYLFRMTADASTGSMIGAVIARDQDQDDIEKVRYSVVSGTEFNVNTETGVLTVAKDLSTGAKSEYSMEIRATDSTKSNDARVRVNVEYKNMYRPEFTKCGKATIQENLLKGQLIATVTATDRDQGRNGEVEYKIVPVGGQDFFTINNKTGEVITTSSLDRETKATYTVIITAEDGGHGKDPAERLMSYCFLEVEVQDVNDNYPSFITRAYLGSIQNTKPIGTSVLTVSATDPDAGDNAKITYAFKSPNDKFEIDSTSGDIRTKVALTGTKDVNEKMTVVASNTEAIQGGDANNRDRETEVTIYITDLAPPVCDKNLFTARILESLSVNSDVLKVSAQAPGGKSIVYSPVKANADIDEKFSVETNGQIKTASQLDYEQLSPGDKTFKLQVRAQEENTNLYSTCSVAITLEDVNDDKPTFDLGNYDARVRENAPIGTTVITIKATDRDTGDAGVVTYFLKAGSDEHFAIDVNSGTLTTKKSFDREGQSLFSVIVIARDKGNNPGALSEEVAVKVLVVDENDSPPQFDQAEFQTSVSESATIGTSILEVVATDQDIGDNAKLEYFISGGDGRFWFAVQTISKSGRTYGEVQVDARLDFETKSSYTIDVTATDGRFSATTRVLITITDANDIVPMFMTLTTPTLLSPIYTGRVSEMTGSGVEVLKVYAVDTDSPNIQYTLEGSSSYFTIAARQEGGKFVGIISTGSQPLDREATPIFSFNVLAKDGVHTGSAYIEINVTDINDNQPRFPNSLYVGYVEENKAAGTSVMYVQAHDDDDPYLGGNAEIRYTLTDNAGGKFKIDANTALVTTEEILDRETSPNSFTITVLATDQGANKLSTTKVATIYVTDANDHAPVFTKRIFRGTVSEDVRPGYVVTSVSATDTDTGPNAELEFVVTHGNEPAAFYVDPSKGTVHVSGILNYTLRKSYNLTVTVSDRGMPVLSDNSPAYVLITITDANDNAPIFIPNQYNKTVAEDLAVGSPVVVVTAVDYDSGDNAKFVFDITGGNPDDLFEVVPNPDNSSLGIVRTRLPLDRETTPIHHLEITAKDTGGLTGKAHVWLTLLDVNDNGPWFQPPFFVGKIKENVNVKQFVTKVSANDPDTKNNGAPFTYAIYNGTVSGNFAFDIATITNVTTDMSSSGTFDRETMTTWTIGIAGTDSGRPAKSNFTYVYVDVQDDNDNEPYDGRMTIIVNSYNGKFRGGPIAKTYYRDADYDGDVNTYTLQSQTGGNFFTVDTTTGEISAAKDIPVGEYSLVISVTEVNTGNPPRANEVNFPKTVTSRATVIVRDITSKAVSNSVALQISDMRKVEYFVGDYHDVVVGELSRMFGVSSSGIEVFSVQPSPIKVMALDVQFAVKTGSDEYTKPYDVIRVVTDNRERLTNLGLKVTSIGIDMCALERERVGKCINVVETSSAYKIASGDYGKVPAPASSITLVSMDVVLRDKYVTIIEPGKNCSNENPCLNGGTCHDTVPAGWRVCQCPRGYRGPHCEQTTRTFRGTSYIWLPKLTAYDIRELSFEFTTEFKDGLMLYQGPLKPGDNNGAKDFLAVFLDEGHLVVRVSLGYEPITINMTRRPNLNDKEWHTVQIIRDVIDRKMIRVIIDRCQSAQIVEENGRVFEKRDTCEITGRVKGRSVYLNGFGPLQIGGVETDLTFIGITTTGFRGCIRNIIDTEKMYDLRNPIKVVNAPEGCTLAGTCPNNCNDKGYCEPSLMAGKSMCVCDLGYTGRACNDRSEANYYLENSFSQFLLTGIRARRELIQPPVPLMNEYYTHINLQVKLDPGTKDCVLFLSSNSLGTEFNRLDVKDHMLRYIFRLGDRMKVLSIPQYNISDGKYHSVMVNREGNYAEMQIDYRAKMAGTTGGVQKLLNMGGGSIFTGGLPNITEVRVVEAIVQSGGDVILRTEDGKVLTSGIGVGGGMSFGAGSSVTLITIGSGVLTQRNILDSQSLFVRGIYKNGTVLYGSSSSSTFGMNVDDQGIPFKSSDTSSNGNGGVQISQGNPMTYGAGIQWTLSNPGRTQVGAGNSGGAVEVIGDMEGCTATNRFQGVSLEDSPDVEVRRQNVRKGCPCAEGFCENGGTCVDGTPPYCLCSPGWTGPTCVLIVTAPNPGQRPGSRVVSPFVIACVAVVLLAVMVIMGAVLLKKRTPPPVIPVMVEDGHVHDNIRPYHDEGAGEEDNFGYDITQLMKYTYVEGGGYGGGGGGYGGGGGGYGDGTGGAAFGSAYAADGGGKGGLGSGVEEVMVAEEKPLLQGAMEGYGQQHGITTITRRRMMNADSVDVGNFINSRVGEADREYILSYDALHIYRYEGDDSDIDDLSELGSDDEGGDDAEQSFDFLQDWGRKFENLNKIYNLDD